VAVSKNIKSKRLNFGKGLSSDRAFKLVMGCVLAVIVIFFFILLVSMASFTNWHTFWLSVISGETLFAIRLSVITASISTLIGMLIAVPVAYAVSQYTFPGKDIIDSLLDVPIILSPIAVGAALLIFFGTPVGSFINNNLLRFTFSVPGIVIAQVSIVTALAIRLLKSTFDSIDPRYEQVARTLGCNKPKAFYKITLPLAQNGLIAAGILTWARAVGEFGAAVMLAGATPLKTETLPIAIYLAMSTADVDRAIAIIFILIIIALVALFLMRKLTHKSYPI
jgi:molybdate transport system permease protein